MLMTSRHIYDHLHVVLDDLANPMICTCGNQEELWYDVSKDRLTGATVVEIENPCSMCYDNSMQNDYKEYIES